jgi:hypothetical protein
VKLDLIINDIPLELGSPVSAETLAEAEVRAAGLLQRLVRRSPRDGTFVGEDCELRCFGDGIHIYPCTHGYLNRDRQWHTRVALDVRRGKLRRVLFRVVDGHTAAENFLQRFREAAEAAIGEPVERDRRRAVWRRNGTLVRTYLHPDRINADIEWSLVEARTEPS